MRLRRLAAFAAALALLAVPLARAAAPAPAASAARDCPPLAQPFSAADDAAGLRDGTDSGFLWKATKDGRTSWLYGTIHVAQRDWRYPGPHVLAAIKASDAVVLELDADDPDTVTRLQRLLARKPGAPELPPALAARLRAQMAEACIAPTVLDGLRPEMRAVTVEILGGRRLGLQPDYGIDRYLAELARSLGKPVRALETPELQASLLVSDDPRETQRSVADLLDELESGRAPGILGRLADDWRTGKLDDLSAYADWCGCLDTPAQRADFARLIDARNPAMAARIAEWHAAGRALFVAVGSLHMTGSIGLPALLREKGFEVERVEFAATSK